MNGRNCLKSIRSKINWVALCMGATLLMFSLPGIAQSQSGGGVAEAQTKTVRIWDACDPETFNAAVGPGTCEAGHHGQTKFQDFFGELQLDQIAGGVPVPSYTVPSRVMCTPAVSGPASTAPKFLSKISKPAMSGISPI